MKVSIITLIITCFSVSVLGWKLDKGKLSIGSNSYHFDDTQSVGLLQLVSAEPLKVSFTVLDDSGNPATPHQAQVVLSNGKGLEYAVTAPVKSGSAQVQIPIEKIPKALLHQDRIFLSSVIGSFDGTPSITPFASFEPTKIIRESFGAGYQKPERLAAKPEIRHIFRPETPTISTSTAFALCTVPLALILVLIATWLTLGKANIASFPLFDSSLASGERVKRTVYAVVFLAIIVGYEITFVRYYLADSIFLTLGRAAALAIPALWFGSRTLKHLTLDN